MKRRMAALQVALNNEMKEHEFYLKNAVKTKHPVGKAMFQQIAGEELEHYERLKQIHENWKNENKWPETVPLEVKETIVRNILRDAVQKAPKTAKGDPDDLNAIRIAIEFEANSAEFYANLRDNVSDQKEKTFFNLLADIEHEHYVTLKDTEEYMTDPVSWFRIKEKTSLDGD